MTKSVSDTPPDLVNPFRPSVAKDGLVTHPPVGGPVPAENGVGCPLTPLLYGPVWRSGVSRALGAASWALQCCFEHAD
jgi:hypothetical protein